MSAARAARPVAVRGARNHGTSPQEIFEAKEAWFKVSIAATAFIALPYTAFTVVKELSHEHHEKVDFSHMHRESLARREQPCCAERPSAPAPCFLLVAPPPLLPCFATCLPRLPRSLQSATRPSRGATATARCSTAASRTTKRLPPLR